MTTFESSIKTILYPQETIFNALSDLRNLERVKDKIPEDKIKDLHFDEDSMKFRVDLVGEIGMRIIEREFPATIKFAAENSPIEFNLWIQLKEVTPSDCRMKMTIKADLSPMIKMMIKGQMEKFLELMADAIATYDYSK